MHINTRCFVDINGDRAAATVVPLLELLEQRLRPDVVVVKSRELTEAAVVRQRLQRPNRKSLLRAVERHVRASINHSGPSVRVHIGSASERGL